MRTARSFNEVFHGVFNDAPSDVGKILSVDLSDQPDIPAETKTESDDSLFALCDRAAWLLGTLGSAVNGLREAFHYRYVDQLGKEKKFEFVPYKEGSNTEFDLGRIGDDSGGPESGEELDTFYTDFLSDFDQFRGGMTLEDTGRPLYSELVEHIQKIREKIAEEDSNIQDMYERGVLGNTAQVQKKRVVEYIRPVNIAQKILLDSDLSQPFYFGENAFTPVNPTDYLDPKLVTGTTTKALKTGFAEALKRSRQKDDLYLSVVKKV